MISEAHRQIRMKTPLAADRVVFRSMRLIEEISTPYEMHLEMYSDDRSINFAEMLGHNVTVALDRSRGGPRFFNGFVTQFGFAGSRGPRYIYKALVSPWLWFLSQTETCRIFHEESVVDIVKAIFRDNGFTDFKVEVNGSYPAYEYCVQYQETDLNFISRLLEKEGLFYYFVHENGSHTLVITDSTANLVTDDGYGEIELFAPDDFSTRRREGIFSWRPRQSILPTTVTLNDFNFEKPDTSLQSQYNIPRDHAVANLEVYNYPGEYADAPEGERYSRTRLEAVQVNFEIATAEANARGLRAGYVFDLSNHPVESFNRKHVVVSANHELNGDSFESGGEDKETYFCTIGTIPADTPYRPRLRAQKPRIIGPQTAIVVNDTEGEEIEPDKYGRVKVLFHWSRKEQSSCWVRVSQAWAGAEWGGMSIPRAGHEVVVEFINGDPDRPIITGRVYNANAMPPYPPHEKPTITTFKTNSSKGGGGFNEIRLDDKKGNENVFIHAEKDVDLRTKNIRRELVANEVHTRVGKKEFRDVGEELHETVGDFMRQSVGQDIHIDAGMNILESAGGEYIVNAGTNAHLKVGVNTVIESGAGLTLKVGGSFITINSGGIFISGPMVMINSGGSALSGAGTKPEIAEEPAYAKTAEPGAISPPARARSHTPSLIELDSHPVSASMLAAARSGSIFCKLCNR